MVWFQKAVDNNENAIAQFNIGSMYYTRKGAEESYCMALECIPSRQSMEILRLSIS